MKKILIVIGSARNGGTLKAAKLFAEEVCSICEAEAEYIFLSKSNLEMCRGCKLCFDKGEQYCPLTDSRNKLIEKIDKSHAMVLATPNYAFHVSGMMKNFIDRITYTFHRPRYFDKTFTSIVAQGMFGGNAIEKYLDGTGKNMGFQTTKGCVVKTIEPTPEKDVKRNIEEIKKAAKRFAKQIEKETLPKPSLFRLMMFRISRHAIKAADKNLKDYDYYDKKGWFESDYYYETKLGPFRRILGSMGDLLGKTMAN